MKQLVTHIVDDASWGGVNRLLECLEASHEQASDQHVIMRVARGTRRAPKFKADVIVSHTAVCWKNLPFFSSLRATYPETPLVHVEHSYSERYAALKARDIGRLRDLQRLTYAMFDRIVAVSEPQAQWLLRRGLCQPDQLETITSCVKLGPFFAVADERPSGPFRLGCIGRFHEQKGFDLVVEAFRAAGREDMQLVLVGDGPMQQELMRRAARHPGIAFHPSTSQPAQAMAACDAIAMPSRWEPYGLVALEAMAAGRQVYCSLADGLLQHIQNGAIGVPENTIEGWASAIMQMHRDEAAGRKLPGRVASAEGSFIKSWNKLVGDLVNLQAKDQKAA